MLTNMPQRISELIGKYGCNFLSLIYIAQEALNINIDIFDAYKKAVDKGAMREDCWINSNTSFLFVITGLKWEMIDAGLHYISVKDEYEKLQFEREVPGNKLIHFVVGDGSGKVKWDPYGKSLTAEKGRLVARKIFKLV